MSLIGKRHRELREMEARRPSTICGLEHVVALIARTRTQAGSGQVVHTPGLRTVQSLN